MKKMIAFILVITISCSLCGCFAKMTPVENFLLASKKMDISAMREQVTPDESAGSFYSKLEKVNLDEEALQTLRDLYALVQYTVGEVTSRGDGKTVSLTVKAPEMERIRSLATAQILASGDSATEVIAGMIADGSISKSMMKEYKLSVKMTETGDTLKIPYGDKDNADFVKVLAIAEMIDFMT